MTSDFFSKFSKPKAWSDYEVDDVEASEQEARVKSSKAASAAAQTVKGKLPELLDTSVRDLPEYSFKISPEEVPQQTEKKEAAKAPTGLLGYFKQKGQELSDMVRPELSNLVKHFEGFRDTAYLPTKNDVPTIGYGMTKGVKLGDKITKEEADKLLDTHLQEYQELVKSMVKVPLKDNQLDALTSLVYNVGPTAFKKSRALAALNAGDLDTFNREAFDPEHGFVKQGKEVLAGLVNRREKERELFNA